MLRVSDTRVRRTCGFRRVSFQRTALRKKWLGNWGTVPVLWLLVINTSRGHCDCSLLAWIWRRLCCQRFSCAVNQSEAGCNPHGQTSGPWPSQRVLLAEAAAGLTAPASLVEARAGRRTSLLPSTTRARRASTARAIPSALSGNRLLTRRRRCRPRPCSVGSSSARCPFGRSWPAYSMRPRSTSTATACYSPHAATARMSDWSLTKAWWRVWRAGSSSTRAPA